MEHPKLLTKTKSLIIRKGVIYGKGAGDSFCGIPEIQTLNQGGIAKQSKNWNLAI